MRTVSVTITVAKYPVELGFDPPPSNILRWRKCVTPPPIHDAAHAQYPASQVACGRRTVMANAPSWFSTGDVAPAMRGDEQKAREAGRSGLGARIDAFLEGKR